VPATPPGSLLMLAAHRLPVGAPFPSPLASTGLRLGRDPSTPHCSTPPPPFKKRQPPPSLSFSSPLCVFSSAKKPRDTLRAPLASCPKLAAGGVPLHRNREERRCHLRVSVSAAPRPSSAHFMRATFPPPPPLAVGPASAAADDWNPHQHRNVASRSHPCRLAVDFPLSGESAANHLARVEALPHQCSPPPPRPTLSPFPAPAATPPHRS
jgi:hypothetical protein